MRIRVLGAGVAGLASAVELAERGAQVEVFELSERLGAGSCSWYAAGMLAPGCELESAEPLIERLGREAIEWWQRRYADTAARGTLVVAPARDQVELGRFVRRARGHEWLSGEELAALEPDLAGRFDRALLYRAEGHLDPRAALAALAQRLAQLRVPLRLGVAADEERADCVLDCRGLAARDALPELRGVKGEMVLLSQPELHLRRPVRLLHPRIPVYVVPRGDGRFMVGATMIESDQASRVSARSVLELLGAAYALHPAFGEAEVVEIGAGVRPAFPDHLPRLCRRGQTFYLNGLYRHGFLLAPAMAVRAAQAMLEGRYPADVMCDEDPGERRLA